MVPSPIIHPQKANGNQSTNDPIPQIIRVDDPAIPEFYHRKPSDARNASSKYLGEATMEAREKTIAEDTDEEFSLVIEGTRNLDNAELFDKSVMAIAHSSKSSSDLLDCFLAEGVNSMTIKPMGGLAHLITFDSAEEKAAMIESCWLEKWFLSIQNINDATVAQWRQTTITIIGVPLTAWHYSNFHNIASLYGRVVSVDYSKFDSAHVTIITDCLFKINCKLHLKIDDTKFPVFTFE